MLTLLMITIAVLVSISNLFVYSYFGQGANETHMEISDCFFQTEWFYLPNYLQKYFVIIIANAQRPLYYHGFGVANINLNTFIQVLEIELKFLFSNTNHSKIISNYADAEKCNELLYDV